MLMKLESQILLMGGYSEVHKLNTLLFPEVPCHELEK